MGRTANDIISSYIEGKNVYSRYQPNDRIKAVLEFIDVNNFGRWHFAKANFGENFKWAQHDTTDIKYNAIQRQGYFTFQDIENMKGLNYGQYEFGAEHYCVIATLIRRGMKTVHILPMTSLKGKTASAKWDIVISPSEYQFLKYDTIIHVGRIQEIGVERFSIKDMKKYLLKNFKQPYKLSGIHISEVKKIIKNKFL